MLTSGHTSIVKMLLDRHADFTSSDSNGATPLHYAAQNNFAVNTQFCILAAENLSVNAQLIVVQLNILYVTLHLDRGIGLCMKLQRRLFCTGHG